MDLNRIKKFAQGSRRKLITQIESRLEYVLGHDDAYLRAHAKEKTIIQQLYDRRGRKHLLEEVAYTWFNRLAALRYMDAKDFFTVRVVTPAAGETQPQILAEVKAGRFPDQIQMARSQINDYLDGRVQTTEPEREAYKAGLLAWCNAMGEVLPFLFTTVEDWAALLLPTDLLSRDSIVSDFQTGMKGEDCTDVEIIGWLYQFYISEKKDEVIGKVVASEDIPAATQLFTPNWIVKYMVQNSLGAQWMATYPDSSLKGQMEYYIEPAEQSDEVQAQLAAITPSALDPEELTLIDPACGSGHILTEAYDLFKAIYLERGYPQQEVPQLILEKNLFGLDIDERAAQLTGFALMMKARADDRQLFERSVKLNVMALVDSTDFDAERLAKGVELGDYVLQPSDLTELKRLFDHATTFGSLIQVPEGLAKTLPALRKLSEATSQDLFVSDALKHLGPLVQQVEMLAARYDAMVANPPYMGNKSMNAIVKKFVKGNYPDTKSDLFACFIERGYSLARDTGYNAMVTMQSWMFLSSFEAMRDRLLEEKTIRTMAHLGARAFGSISGEIVQTSAYVVQNRSLNGFKPVFFRLIGGGEEEKRTALANGENRFDRTAQNEFQKIPGSPVAYWVTDKFRLPFSKLGCLEDIALFRQGMSTTAADRFEREWTEIDRNKLNTQRAEPLLENDPPEYWYPFNKGGARRRWYGNLETVVRYERNGQDLLDLVTDKYPNISDPEFVIKNRKYFFLSAVTYASLGTGAFYSRLVPNGCAYSVAGPAIFPEDWEPAVLVSLLCSSTTSLFLSAINPTVGFQKADVGKLPVTLQLIRAVSEKAKQLADGAVCISKADWNAYEHSWDFQTLPFFAASSEPMFSLESSYAAWIAHNRDTIAEMKRLEEANNRLFIDAYGLADELTSDVPIEQITLTVNPAYRYGGNLTDVQQWNRFREDTMRELVSYAIGCIMGRYSLDKPGLTLANAGDGIQDYLNQVPQPSFMPDDDAILPITAKDDFEDDLPSRVRAFVLVAFGKEHYDENIRFLEDGLGHDIKTYVLRHFYKDHLKYYKTRPIYWMVSSPSGAFRCLIYLHRYTQDTVGTILGSYLRPYRHKLEARREQSRRIIDSATGSSADKSRAQKTVDEITRTLQELEQWEREVVYPLAQERIALDLDDGVKVNYGKLGAILEKVKGLNT